MPDFNELSINDIQKILDEILIFKNSLPDIESLNKLFYTINDVQQITHWSKKTVQDLFNHPDFPCTDFGKTKLVFIPAFFKFFMTRHCKYDSAVPHLDN
jgi:hypothetical protein